MFTVIKCLRACRPIFRPLDVSEKFASLTGAQSFLQLHNQQQPWEVRPRHFSSVVDPNQDPLSEYESIYPLNSAHLHELTDGNPVEVKRVRLLQMELAVKAVESPHSMPRKITFEEWRNLLSMSTTSQGKYLKALKRKEGKYKPKEVQNDEPAEYDDSDFTHSVFVHKLFRNALFPMLHINSINAAMNARLVEGILFNSTIVMDCGYENVMNIREMKNLGQQLGQCINANKSSRKPFNMVFCNLKKESTLGELVWRAMPNIYEPQVPLITSEECYTTMFPKEKLVYLTPHCRDTVQYNPEDIYIIGAMVDKTNPGPHSLIKAKAQGIRMASFPIDKHLIWKCGTKSLTLNQVVMILLRMAETGDWSHALNVVPKRKILDLPVTNFEKKHRVSKFF